MVEGRRLRLLRRIDQRIRQTAGAKVAIPEASIRQPYRMLHAVIHQRVHVVRHKLLRLRIVRRRILSVLLGQRGKAQGSTSPATTAPMRIFLPATIVLPSRAHFDDLESRNVPKIYMQCAVLQACSTTTKPSQSSSAPQHRPSSRVLPILGLTPPEDSSAVCRIA